MPKKYVIHSLIYVVATLGANYTAAWFIPFPIFGQVAVGTFVFGVTFTQRDKLHDAGRQWVYGTIAIAALANVLMSAVLAVPLRIIGASFLAIVLAETADTEIYQKLLRYPWLMRVAGSNAVSIPLDTLLFTLIAFAGDLSTTARCPYYLGKRLPNTPSAFWLPFGARASLSGKKTKGLSSRNRPRKYAG